MADTILGGDITVRYLDDNRSKFLRWTGSPTGTRTANELYSAMATLLDEPTTGDDATCMTAETPVEYTIGLIDANDADPWFIQYECMQHITGGAVRSSGGTHVDSSAVGIIVVAVAPGGAVVPADIGFTAVGATTGSGTLLEVIVPTSGGTEYLVIRPDTNASSDQFTTNAQNITANAHVSVQTAAAVSHTGEQIWANLFNILPVDSNTHVYFYRGTVADAARTRVLDVNNGNNADDQDWWPEGSFDIAIYTNDFTTENFTTIDLGFITGFSRKGSSLYDSFAVSTSLISGGSNPVPLKPSADTNRP